MYDSNYVIVLTVGDFREDMKCITHIELLEVGERIIGYKSSALPHFKEFAFHDDF